MRLASYAFKLLLSAAVLSISVAARADTFSWSVIATGFSGSGTFTATPSGTLANAQNITSIKGIVNGFAVTQLLPANYDPVTPARLNLPDGLYFNYDNIFYTFGPVFDFHGLLFELSNGIYVNLYNVGKNPQVTILNGDPVFDSANFTPLEATITTGPAPVPEPSSFLLLGSGLLSLSAALRRKRA